MPIEFRCPECRKLLRTPDGTAGLEAQCPRCQAIAVVPGGLDPDRAERELSTPPPLPPRDDAAERFPDIDVAGRNPFAGYAPASTAAEGAPAEFNPYASPATIDTSVPLGDGVRRDLASRFERFGGAVVDGLLTLAGAAVGFAIAAAGAVDAVPPEDQELVATALIYAGMLPIAVVQWALIASRGQSLGKMAVGTRIVLRHGGGLPGFYRGVVLRAWLPVAIGVLCCRWFFLIDVLAIFGRERRCVHDEFANTIVVRVR